RHTQAVGEQRYGEDRTAAACETKRHSNYHAKGDAEYFIAKPGVHDKSYARSSAGIFPKASFAKMVRRPLRARYAAEGAARLPLWQWTMTVRFPGTSATLAWNWLCATLSAPLICRASYSAAPRTSSTRISGSSARSAGTSQNLTDRILASVPLVEARAATH